MYQKMEDKYFLALDLEMNCADQSSNPCKIIQVGIVLGTYKNFIDKTPFIEFNWYINPNEKIHHHITDLTGITDEMVQFQSSTYNKVHDEIKSLINTYNCFPNPIVWGSGDTRLLIDEIKNNVGHCHIFGHRDIDTKTIHTVNLLVNGKATKSSLRSALNFYKLKFDGIPHRAVDDARNTLILYFTMIDRQIKINEVISKAQALK